MNIRNTLIALWTGMAIASAGNVKGLPPKFTFGIVPRKVLGKEMSGNGVPVREITIYFNNSGF